MQKILLLEDNITDAELVSHELKIRWPVAELKVVGRVSEARNLLQNEPSFNVAIFDLKLPDGNGMDLLVELRKQNYQTPIIILTGEGSEEIATAALKAGANDYITKKFGYYKLIPDQIEFTVKHALESKKHLSVLYVEHHKSDKDLTQHYFKNNAPQIHFTFVSTGEEALNLLPVNDDIKCNFDVLLLDYQLPGFNALEISKIIRHERNLSIAIVIVTGQGDEKIAVEALKIGVDDYITKRENYLLRMPSVVTSAYNRKELERQKQFLIESEKRLIKAQIVSHMGFIDWNLKTNILELSDEVIRLYGLNKNEKHITPERLISLLPPEDKEIVQKNLEAAINGEKTYSVDHRIIRPDGKIIWVQAQANLIIVDGVKKSLLGTIVDITERKKIEEKLSESERKFRLLADNTYDWEYWINPENKYIYLSKSVERITGYSPEDFYINEEIIFDLIHPDFKEMVHYHYYNEEGKQKSKDNIEFLILTLKGEERWIEHNCSPVFDNEGNFLGRRGNNRDITERKKAEHDITKLSTAVEQSPAVIVITDLTGAIEYVNPKFTQLTGFQPEEVIGENTRIMRSGLQAKEFYTKLWEDIKLGNEWRGEFHNKKKNEEFFWESASVSPIFNKKGKITNYLKVAEDITERKIAEEKLVNSEERFKQIVENSGEWVWEVDSNGLYTFGSHVIETLLGYKIEEIIGKKHFYDFFLPQEKEEFKSSALEMFNNKQAFHGFINRNIAKDGSIVWLSTSGVPIVDKKGNLIGYRGADTNITESKRSEQIQDVILNISNATQEADDLSETMQIIQKQLGRLMDTTNFFVALYNKKTDQVHLPFYQDEKDAICDFPVGKTLTELVIKNEKPLLIDVAEATKLENEGKIEKVGFDSLIWLGVPLKIKGKITGAFVLQSYTDPKAFNEKDKEVLEIISHQISISIERKREEEKLLNALESAKESDRLKSAFLAAMSHELRTPLNAIIGFSSLIDKELSIDSIVDFAKTVNSSGIHLLSIVEDLFDITLIETGEIKIVKENIELESIIDNVKNIIESEQHKLNKDNLNLNFKIPAKCQDLTLITDPLRLKQVLLNLLKNALKFTNKGYINCGCSLELINDKSMLRFYVEDSGIGVPKEKQDIIFNVFRQVEDSDTRTYGGTGLGLSISKKLTQLLGGDIWIESDGKSGSVFYFTIPYNKPPIIESKAETKTKSLTKETTKNKTILIVEDDKDSFEYLNVILKKMAINTLWAINGKMAIKYCNEHPEIDLVLMDINMPEMNGYEATKQIKKIRPVLPIISQTAYAIAGDQKKSIDAGCDDYISKPINRKILIEKIKKLIG